MTQNDKQLLIKDLCARLPYDTIISVNNGKYREDVKLHPHYIFDWDAERWDAKPYFRPMSSMTEEEMSELRQWGCLCMTPDDCVEDVGVYGAIHSIPVIDWLNAHHFDYRGMIEKGLALPAKEGMY